MVDFKIAPVTKTEERPDATRSEQDTVLAEGRADSVDQIADYHDTHKTLNATGDAYDPDLVAEALAKETLKAERKALREASKADEKS